MRNTMDASLESLGATPYESYIVSRNLAGIFTMILSESEICSFHILSNSLASTLPPPTQVPTWSLPSCTWEKSWIAWQLDTLLRGRPAWLASVNLLRKTKTFQMVGLRVLHRSSPAEVTLSKKRLFQKLASMVKSFHWVLILGSCRYLYADG